MSEAPNLSRPSVLLWLYTGLIGSNNPRWGSKHRKADEPPCIGPRCHANPPSSPAPDDYNIALLRRKASQAALLLRRPQDDVISVAKATPSTR